MLCDFQGRLLGSDGRIILNGGASENAESYMPRTGKDIASIRTDIFALGSTIYHIMTGHRSFPELNTIDDEAEFVCRYERSQFPALEADLCGGIVRSCWEGLYNCADEVYDDL
ncbi:hypothetical protein GQ44DRAFT_814232, partial [Phaeosphaeriaceae sp. PMI808]